MKKLIYSFVLSCLVIFSGCSDFFDPETDDTLLESDYIGVYAELYSGYMGLATGVQAVVDQAIFLEGLRGDLLEPTENAPRELWDLYNYADVSNNSFASPVGFYNIILNANDYLQHIYEYREKFPTVLKEEAYKGLAGGALRYKAWAYFMLAKIYGEAVYFDDTLVSFTDLNNYPLLDFDLLIDKCIDLIETGQRGVNGMEETTWAEELFPGQDASPERLEWNRITPTAQCLLAELYLYKVKSTNSEADNITYYQKVWNNCVRIIREGGDEASFQLNLSAYDGSWIKLFSAAAYSRMDHITVAFYDYTLKQTNRIIEYFSDEGNNKYYLRPSESAMNRWVASGANDNNHRGNGKSYSKGTSGWLFSKYIQAHTGDGATIENYKNDVFISYYRASDIHLWLAEACAGLGRHFEALTFLNGGIAAYYDKSDETFIAPFADYPISLYECKGRESLGSCKGVRGRVSALAVGEYLVDEDGNLTVDPEIATQTLDSIFVEESCLESAGEARSYYAMLRMARRYGDKARSDWAKVIAKKYPDGGAAVRAKLESDINNWFIKYDLKLEEN